MKSIKLSAMALVAAASLYAQPRLPHLDSLQINFHVQPCCNTTLERCIKEKPNCTIAPRLRSYLVWMDSTRRFSNERITEQLQERYMMFASGPKHTINNAGWPVDGDPNAPLTVTVYFLATCPMCKSNYAAFHNAVTNGSLKGKVKMVSKPLSDNSTNSMLMAAHQMGKFSEFFLALGKKTVRIDENVMLSVADELKLDKNALKKMSEDPMLKKRLKESSDEATRNGVSYAPSYYIGGRKYNGPLDVRWVTDAIEYEFEAMKR